MRVIDAPRCAARADLGPLSRLWHDAWHDAHSAYLPPALVAARTRADFRARLAGLLPAARLVGPGDAPLGLCIAEEGVLSQLFVAAAVRGRGIGARLLADGEARIAAAGRLAAQLHCHPANTAALRFYQSHGWRIGGRDLSTVTTPKGAVEIEHLTLLKWVTEPQEIPPSA